jgi:hypothetical protein
MGRAAVRRGSRRSSEGQKRPRVGVGVGVGVRVESSRVAPQSETKVTGPGPRTGTGTGPDGLYPDLYPLFSCPRIQIEPAGLVEFHRLLDSSAVLTHRHLAHRHLTHARPRLAIPLGSPR